MKKAGLFTQIPKSAWQKAWVVHSKPVGDGERALKYLAPYVYRVAISNNRIMALDNGRVTFRYKESGSANWKTMTLPVMEFMRRFLQHVLPKGFIKVRYYGLLHPACKKRLNQVKYLITALWILLHNPLMQNNQPPEEESPPPKPPFRCPACGGEMKRIGCVWYRKNRNKAPP